MSRIKTIAYDIRNEQRDIHYNNEFTTFRVSTYLFEQVSAVRPESQN